MSLGKSGTGELCRTLNIVVALSGTHELLGRSGFAGFAGEGVLVFVGLPGARFLGGNLGPGARERGRLGP